MTKQQSTKEKRDNEWWRGACIYQIYPRSFNDTGADGIGDLPGITQKLDYVASLGVDGIWISPFFTSPMCDYGYDVSDYRDVDPMFGTLEDFKELLAKAHALGLKVIIDLAVSHSSDQHPWFIESRKSKDNPKADWYVWADPKPDMFGERVPPNNWVSVFGGGAWEYDETRGQYYLHNFLKEQPDLNFHNPDVQTAVLDIARYWLDLGVDGFRLDVVNFYFHDQELRDNPPREADLGPALQFEGEDLYSTQTHIYDKSRPENLDFIRKLRKLMDEYDDRFTVGEIGDDHPYKRAAEYTNGHCLLNTCYNTHLMGGAHKDPDATLLREPVERFAKAEGGSWPSWAFSNHDVVRVASRWHPHGDGFTHDPRLSKMLNALLGCLRGTIFLYQGEELGLPEARLKFEDLQDPWGKVTWPEWQGRDGCRTPIPWTQTAPEQSWLPMPDYHLPLNVKAQETDSDSTLNFTREFLKWRAKQDCLKTGDIAFLDVYDDNLLAFERYGKEKSMLCLFNLSDQETPVPANLDTNGKTLFPKDTPENAATLPPYGFKIIGKT